VLMSPRELEPINALTKLRSGIGGGKGRSGGVGYMTGIKRTSRAREGRCGDVFCSVTRKFWGPCPKDALKGIEMGGLSLLL